MISERGIDIQNSSHILTIWRYIRNIAYMNELGEYIYYMYQIF